MTEHPPTKTHNHELKAARYVVLGLIPAKGVYEIHFKHEEWCDLLKAGTLQNFCNCDAEIRVTKARMGMIE